MKRHTKMVVRVRTVNDRANWSIELALNESEREARRHTIFYVQQMQSPIEESRAIRNSESLRTVDQRLNTYCRHQTLNNSIVRVKPSRTSELE